MRIPSVFVDFRVLLGISLVLMIIGTLTDGPGLRSWALMFTVLGATSWVITTMNELTGDLMAFIQRWAHEPFESGVKHGIRLSLEKRAEAEILGRDHEENLN